MNILKECEKRMKAVRLTSETKEKYRDICRRVMDANADDSALRKHFAEDLKFLAFSEGNKVLLTEDQYWKAMLNGKVLNRFIVPVKKDENVFAVKEVHGEPLKENLRKLCTLTVYRASINDPILTVNDVAMQTPKGLVSRVKAFTLFLKEENYHINSYNYFTGMYEFEVVLFE